MLSRLILSLLLAPTLLALGSCTDAPGVGDSSPGTVGTGATSAGSSADATAADTSGGAGDRYHPMGFAASDVHGLAAKLQEEDCRTCHGDDLGGLGLAVSCDGCHPAEWRTNCVFCHGGQDTELGAPPRDIDGTTELASLTFRAHTAHVSNGIHAAFDCIQCHTKPTDVLSSNHMFDDTPALSEVDFAIGLSAEGQWAAGTCANLYCHGNGNGQLGAIDHGDPAPGCGDCHGYTGGALQDLQAMSGRHALHAGDGVLCSDCHPATVDASDTIVGLFLHVNGNAELTLPDGVTRNGDACTGLCHGEAHFNENW